MGLRTQLLMGASYFLISRFFPWKNGKEKRGTGLGGKLILYGFFSGSGITFILGILNRFGVDPLGMYKGIRSSYQILFLSTIGQATWYSSYVCTVFAIGLCIFFTAENNKIRIASGLYCVLGFMTLVTQNSDSAFASLALLFTGLFVAACGSRIRWNGSWRRQFWGRLLSRQSDSFSGDSRTGHWSLAGCPLCFPGDGFPGCFCCSSPSA